MNGEMHQLCMIVNAARNALKTASQIQIENDDYVDCIEFKFLPKRKLLRSENYVAHTVEDWFSYCIKEKLIDIKIICPIKEGKRQLLGFANAGSSSVITFYPNAKVTYWTPYWEFVSDRKKWMVSYTEHEWDNAPKEQLRFENNTGHLSKILNEIADFADEIEFPGFANTFRLARRVLDGTEEIPEKYPNGRKIRLPQLTEDKKRMFFAASTADVFGAMGSWNDDPSWYAQKKGLEDKYNRLSDELLRQIRLAVLYAINEE